MSDDWQVVEEALNLRMVIAGRPEGDVKMAEAQIALDRLREREARLMSRGIEDMQHQIARLEEALREIEDTEWEGVTWEPHESPDSIARRALAHEEEK